MLLLRPIFVLMIAAVAFLSVTHFDSLKGAVPSAAPAAIDETQSQLSGSAPPNSPEPQFASDFERGRFAEISAVLHRIPSGRLALDMIDQYEISIHFEAGGGSYFNPNTNEILIDANHDPVRAALSMVHEVTHARYLHEGSGADILSDGRQAYIEKKVGEEVEGVVRSIEAKMALEAAGVDVSGLWYTLEYPYRTAHKAAVEDARAAEPGSREETLATSGREAGKQSVFEGFMNGKTWTSVTKESYPDYYGADWDKINLAS